MDTLLRSSQMYTQILAQKMEMLRAQEWSEAQTKAAGKSPNNADEDDDDADHGEGPSSRKRKSRTSDTDKSNPKKKKGGKHSEVSDVDESGPDIDVKTGLRRQSRLVSGAKLRDYQLAGVDWLIRLWENAVSAILADEMGTGKTLQTIAFLAYLRERGVWGPHIVICPLSVVVNWENEFRKFAPSIPVVVYHGSKAERAEIRSNRLGMRASFGSRERIKKVDDMEYPVILTTYDIVNNDKAFLSTLDYRFLCVDEGHRLKNSNSLLYRVLREYRSESRLILTGTPLQNNLQELYALLSFILPEVFDNASAFLRRFDFSGLTDTSSEDVDADSEAKRVGNEQAVKFVAQLHEILNPFVLRRLKRDVEKNLPLKKEYVLTAPLTVKQKELYDAVVTKQLRPFLIHETLGPQSDASAKSQSPSKTESGDVTSISERVSSRQGGGRKSVGRKSYMEQDDDDYFDDLEEGKDQEETSESTLSAADIGQAYARKNATSKVNNMKLQNIVMQLRKVANHPFLFSWPIDSRTGQQVVNEDLLNASGKMLLLNRLLTALFKEKRKVLLFSQFTSMLDIIHDWANETKGWPVCRIDGNTKLVDRQSQMQSFNEDQSHDACRLFLLSTRSGGVGINLTGADTVILYDSDWNPQMDLQAMDRAHRIGQTKPVLVFRLITAGTIEGKILERAGRKRKLEHLVIGQGDFKGDFSASAVSDFVGQGKRAKGKKELSMAELAEQLLATGYDQIDLAGKGDAIFSDEQLKILLDRSEKVMKSKESWTGKGKGSFEVMETAVITEDEKVDEEFEDIFEPIEA